MIPHDPGTWMNRGALASTGVQPSPNSPFSGKCARDLEDDLRSDEGGGSIREFTGFTCEHCYEHQSWDSRRPSARRPSGIPFHTYPLLSARRPAGAAAALSLCQTKEVLAD